ncbi:DDE-type integrase/transposase/recombinase [Ruegeria sp. 2012CJ15-1]|uniref:DDE-type integrase/transposase/recombinase n=1 Tax=Ruegeria hyattellae TaxID=3233337 RepID=UPI00355B46BD
MSKIYGGAQRLLVATHACLGQMDQAVAALDVFLEANPKATLAEEAEKSWNTWPKRIMTDKLRSNGAAKQEIAPGLDDWSHKGLNNRAENSHLPFRKRQRAMQGYRSPGRCSGSQPPVQLFEIASASRNVVAPH